jgi:hypothetical protein
MMRMAKMLGWERLALMAPTPSPLCYALADAPLS